MLTLKKRNMKKTVDGLRGRHQVQGVVVPLVGHQAALPTILTTIVAGHQDLQEVKEGSVAEQVEALLV